MRTRLVPVWNVLKAWLLVAVGCAAIAAIGWPIGGYRLDSLLIFFALWKFGWPQAKKALAARDFS